MSDDLGASVPDQALVNEAPAGLPPTGFDPSRGYGWWAGSSEEYMDIAGPLKTRDEAIKQGRDYMGGDPFWIVEASTAEWFPPDAYSVFDSICDNGDELFYDDGFPGFDGGKDAEKAAEEDLQRVLNEWFKRHEAIFPTPTAFNGMRNLEQIDVPIIRGSDGNPKGGNAVPSRSDDSAGPEDIAP